MAGQTTVQPSDAHPHHSMETRFVVTAWRDAEELLSLRRHLFATGEDARERAVNKVYAWKARKLEIPLLLESTADLVEAGLTDGKAGLAPQALSMVYASAISRFITGLADTQTTLTRLFPATTTQPLDFPLSLRETRHRIVHRHLPSLAELKRAARECLAWLWEWYWSRLTTALAEPQKQTQLSEAETKERFQALLKTYVRSRKIEIKKRGDDTKAAEGAITTWLDLDAKTSVKTSVLLNLLLDEKNILPMDKKLGTSMTGAYLIWTPFLTALCKTVPSFLQTLTERMVDMLAAPLSRSMMLLVDLDPVREGMRDWLLCILTSEEWRHVRRRSMDGSSGRRSDRQMLDHVLSLCFTTPTFWTLDLAEALLDDETLPGRASWLAILEAARSDEVMDLEGGDQGLPLPPRSATAPDEMEVDSIDAGMPVSETTEPVAPVEKLRGPRKKPGLWRPQPIGWIAPEWEVDE